MNIINAIKKVNANNLQIFCKKIRNSAENYRNVYLFLLRLYGVSDYE